MRGRRALALAALALLLAAHAGAQGPAQGATPVPAPALVPGATMPDASSAPAPDPNEALPSVSTDMQVRHGRAAQGKVTVGDVVILSVRPPPEQGEGAVPPEAKKLETDPIEWGDGRILWWKPFDPITGILKIAVTTYKPGKFTIKRIPFSKNDQPLFATELKEVEFAPVGGDKSKDDIYPPTGVALPLWLLILLGLLSLAIVLGLLAWARRWYLLRKAKHQELANAPRVLTPLEEFEKTRRESEQKGYIEKAVYKPHYFALSDAAKRFLAKSYRFDAEERTSRELLHELEGLGMSVDLIDQWEHVFDEMDLVKFTDQMPLPDTARSLGGRLSQAVALSYAKSPYMRELLAQQQAQKSSKAGAR